MGRASILALALAGCAGPTDHELDADASSGGESSSDGSTGEPPPTNDPCADACADLATSLGTTRCQSCRCKDAFDGWLPSVDELQCSNAEPIVTYHAATDDDELMLEPLGISEPFCANPSLLTGSCRQGSRLGHLRRGDVSIYWICRDPLLELDGRLLFEDVAVVGHNQRTGATCFWDDVDGHTHDDDLPPFDLADATDTEHDAFVDRFGYNDGTACTLCHDHDPFIYTPYLMSTDWQSVAADKGPYHLVTLDGMPRATDVRHLVSNAADPCTSCHRLGSRNTCTTFAPDSLGASKIDAYESAVRDAMTPGSPHWELAYWMPATATTDFDAWQSGYATAREHVLRCCETPGVDTDDCIWAPVPTE